MAKTNDDIGLNLRILKKQVIVKKLEVRETVPKDCSDGLTDWTSIINWMADTTYLSFERGIN